MTFKLRRGANTAMPAKTAIASNYCSCPVARQKCTYGNMAESELLCVRVTILLRKKKCKHSKSDIMRQYMPELSPIFILMF